MTPHHSQFPIKCFSPCGAKTNVCPMIEGRRAEMYNRGVKRLFGALSEKDREFLTTEFNNTVEDAPHYSEYLYMRFYFCEPKDKHHRVLCGVFDVYEYGAGEKATYYSTVTVHPKYRGRHIAKELLEMVVKVLCKEKGKTLVYNVEKVNYGSKKTIEACGGIFIEEWEGHGGVKMLRYELRP